MLILTDGEFKVGDKIIYYLDVQNYTSTHIFTITALNQKFDGKNCIKVKGILGTLYFEPNQLVLIKRNTIKTIYQLVGEYCNIVGKYGPDSEQIQQFRLIHSDNKELIEYADALDRIKQHLGGRKRIYER